MNVELNDVHEQLVRSMVRDGRYASEAEVINEALRLLEHRDRKSAAERRRIESLLLEGLASGPPTAMTSSDWDDIEREGKRIIASRRPSDG